MKTLYKPIFIILLALLAFLPKWGTAQTHWSDSQAGFICNSGTANIILDNNTTLTAPITIMGGTVNLDLNGCILDRNKGGRVVEITGGTLNITDSKFTESHKGNIAYETIGGHEYPYWESDPINGTIEIIGGIITGGRTTGTTNGACINITSSGRVIMNGGNLAGNVSSFNGGAVQVIGSSTTNASFTMNDGSICYNAGVSGGGVIVFQYGTFTMNGGEISYNHAHDWETVSHSGGNGGGVFSGGSGAKLAITTINAGSFIGNYAAKGGGALVLSCPFYDGDNLGSNPTDAEISLKMGATGPVIIKENRAKFGGGISIDGNTSLCLLNGNVTIEGNEAEEDGGGIRCGAYHYDPLPSGVPTFEYKIIRLRIYGGKIINNRAGAGCKGGGIYDNSDYNGMTNRFSTYIDLGSTNSLVVKGNVAGDEPNDIYLTYGRSLTALASNINPQDVGIYTGNTGAEPGLMYSTSGSTYLTPIYDALVAGTTNIFHNNPEYRVKSYSTGNSMYFTKSVSPWSSTQQTTTTSDLHLNNGYYEISSVKELTAFLWHVNGITTHGAFGSGDLTANGKLTADINMSGQYWLPIADGYTGIFDGNGHSINNLTMSRTVGGTERGMFGRIDAGAEIKNLQLHGCSFVSGGAPYVGCIASKLNGGTIHNCVADGTLTASSSPAVMGGLVGLVDNSAAAIHSTCAMATLSGGSTMGGLVGELASGSLKNSFANTTLTTSGTVGGLVGSNSGTVDNCYVRGTTSFTGTAATGTVTHCYGPSGTTVSGSNGEYGNTETPYLYMHADNQVTVGSTTKSLLEWLNNWVAANGSSIYASWMRTCASPINGDYPLLKFDGMKCVGSKSGSNDVLTYSNSLNSLLSTHNASGDNIFFWGAEGTTASPVSTNVNANVYFDEDAVLIHTGTITNAYVGITLDNSAGAGGANPTWGGSDAIDWHMFSTPLTAAPLGINYNDNNTQYAFSWGHPSGMPYWHFYQQDNANHGYFPDRTYGTSYDGNATSTATAGGNYYDDWDFYSYYEPDAHWINFKRNGNSHWIEPEPHSHIDYKAYRGATANKNEEQLIKGKGYLVATKEPTYLQCSGTLTNEAVSLPLFCQGYYRTGYNLLGNPYQSYLDFNAFADANSGSGSDKIWSDKTNACYYIIDEDHGGYLKYVYSASSNEYIASSYLHPHQGFMVIAEREATASFTLPMRNTTATGVTFRGDERPAYPLVNLIATEENGNRDVCTVELDRPDKGGAPVMRDLRICKGLIYCHYDDEDWGIAFTQPGLSEAAIRFETVEDANFTMTWDTENGDFSYLHLIDNLTGTDIDCLATDEYKFTSHTSDYASRFRLVFDYTGIDEPEEDGPSTGSGTFAFQMGNEIVLNGEGRLEVIDMLGRIVRTEELQGSQSTVRRPETVGVYVLRLTGRDGVKAQKIVIR